MLVKDVEDMMNVLQVFHTSVVEDDDIIQVYDHKKYWEQAQDIIHHPHKYCWGIIISKRHDQPLKNVLFTLEGCLP